MTEKRDAPLESPRTGAELAMIGEDAESQAISLKTLQAVYNELTGKTEELSRRYDRPFQLTLSDLEQLNIKFGQVCEQYHVEATSASVTVFHLDDTKEVFSSFERFRLYNTSATSPVEQVVLKYSFLFVLPKTKKPQTYTVEVRLMSRVVAVRKIRRDAPPFVRVLGGQTAIVRVEYVDYMVARSLLGVTDGWFSAANVAHQSGWFKWVRGHSELFRHLGAYLVAGATLYSVFKVLPSIVPEAASQTVTAGFVVASVAALFVAYRSGLFVGSKVEDALDSWEELAFLRLNRGDEVEIAAATRDNRRALITVVAGGVATFVLSVVASVVANAISSRL